MLTHLQVVQSCRKNWLQNIGNDLERDESVLHYEDFSCDVYSVMDWHTKTLKSFATSGSIQKMCMI